MNDEVDPVSNSIRTFRDLSDVGTSNVGMNGLLPTLAALTPNDTTSSNKALTLKGKNWSEQSSPALFTLGTLLSGGVSLSQALLYTWWGSADLAPWLVSSDPSPASNQSIDGFGC